MDGSRAISRGSVTLHVSFGDDGSPPITLLKLIDPLAVESQAAVSGGKVNYGPQTAIISEFYVLDNLQVDIILGVDILQTVDAFVQHNRHFRFTPTKGLYDMFLIEQLTGIAKAAKAWARKRGSGSTTRMGDRVDLLLEQIYEIRLLDENL